MPATQATVLDADELERLRAWLSVVTGAPVDRSDIVASSPDAGLGFSNRTILITTRPAAGRAAGEYAVRLQIPERRLFPGASLAREHRALSLLAAHGVPVPQVLDADIDGRVFGQPAMLMRRIAGRSPADNPVYTSVGWLKDATPDQRRCLWTSAVETLAAVHRVPTDAFDDPIDAELLRAPADTLRYWRELFESARVGAQPLAEAAFDWLGARVPAGWSAGFSWGDARFANMIFDQFRCVGVLDMEMASNAGPLLDLGWWLACDRLHSEMYGLARLDGLGSRDETVALWRERTGLGAPDLDWYEVFGALRFHITVMRVIQVGRAAGWIPAYTDEPADPSRNTHAAHLLARQLDLPEPGPRWKP